MFLRSSRALRSAAFQKAFCSTRLIVVMLSAPTAWAGSDALKPFSPMDNHERFAESSAPCEWDAADEDADLQSEVYGEPPGGSDRQQFSVADVPVGASGSVSIGGEQQFGAEATVSGAVHSFALIDVSAYYRVREADGWGWANYGPLVMGKLRLPNPTIITPFVGVGPGYEKWWRRWEGEIFDRGASLILGMSAGCFIRFSEYVGLSISRTRIEYLTDQPKRFGEPERNEGKHKLYSSASFVFGLMI